MFPLPPFLKSTNISVAEISQGLLLVSGSVQPIMTSFSSNAFTRSHKGLWEIICSSKVHCVIHEVVLGIVYGFWTLTLCNNPEDRMRSEEINLRRTNCFKNKLRWLNLWFLTRQETLFPREERCVTRQKRLLGRD